MNEKVWNFSKLPSVEAILYSTSDKTQQAELIKVRTTTLRARVKWLLCAAVFIATDVLIVLDNDRYIQSGYAFLLLGAWVFASDYSRTYSHKATMLVEKVPMHESAVEPKVLEPSESDK